FIGWVLNPDPAKRPSMADVLNHAFLAKEPDQGAIELIHETGQLQDFLDWGPSDIRQFSADTGIEEVQVRAMIQYLRVGRDDGPEADMPDGDTIAGFVNSFRDFMARPTEAPHASFIFALHDRVEAFATAHPSLVANAPGNGANAGGPAIVAAPDSVKGVLGRLGEIKPAKGAKAYGVAPGETVKGVKDPQYGVRVRNKDRNVLQRITDRLTGANVARGKAAQQSVEHLVKRFEDQPGAKEILANLRSTIRNPRRTLRVAQLADTLTALVKKFDLDSPDNTALKEFVSRKAAGVLDFAEATGIPEELVAVMQAHLRHRSGLLERSASEKPPSLKRVADFVRSFDQYIREAPTVLTDPAILALESEVRAFTLSRPDLLDLRAGLVHTPALAKKVTFSTAARLLAQPGKLDPKRAADAAKQLARLIIRSLQDPENADRHLPMLFACSNGMEYRRELLSALRVAIAEQGPNLRPGAVQSPLRPKKLDTRLATFSKAVYAEVLKGLKDHCDGDEVIVASSGANWTKGKALNGNGATADLFVYENGDDTVVVKELKPVKSRFTDSVPIEHFCDFEEARLHRHINVTAEHVAPSLYSVVQSDQGGVRFVMEHAVYGDLNSFIATNSGAADPVRDDAVHSLLKQVAENLYELHTFANVGHVDFKPANVLLTRGAGGAVLAQLTDFGASREGKTMFLRDDPVDSAQWKSPERVPALKVPDARFSTHAADVWAFGVTMYQMYAKDGNNPFDSTSTGFTSGIGPKILDYAKNYSPTAISGSTLDFVDNKIPKDVRPIIHWILNPDPVARPTMAEILLRMKEASPLSVEAHNFIQASVGADLNVVADAADASGGKTRTPTGPNSSASDQESSSGDAAPPVARRAVRIDGNEESSSVVESSENAPENRQSQRASRPESDSDVLVQSSESPSPNVRERRASGSGSDSSAEESPDSADESQPTGTF
ncbi:MAG: Serine/threonine-protein kinase pkn3, partial [Herminiimonas sp.]|nr:Serine/threonine-protein kinase pkn3 [Herminiimonas sp.]